MLGGHVGTCGTNTTVIGSTFSNQPLPRTAIEFGTMNQHRYWYQHFLSVVDTGTYSQKLVISRTDPPLIDMQISLNRIHSKNKFGTPELSHKKRRMSENFYTRRAQASDKLQSKRISRIYLLKVD